MEEDGGEEGDEGEANDEDAELPSPRMSRQPHRKSIRSTAKLSLSLSPPPQDRHVQRSPGDEEELLFPPSFLRRYGVRQEARVAPLLVC